MEARLTIAAVAPHKKIKRRILVNERCLYVMNDKFS